MFVTSCTPYVIPSHETHFVPFSFVIRVCRRHSECWPLVSTASVTPQRQLHLHFVTNTELHKIYGAPTACGVTKILQYSAIIGTANGKKYFDVISENNVLYVDYLIVLQSRINAQRNRGTATNPFATPAALQKSKNDLQNSNKILCVAPVNMKPVYIKSERPEKLHLSRRKV